MGILVVKGVNLGGGGGGGRRGWTGGGVGRVASMLRRPLGGRAHSRQKVPERVGVWGGVRGGLVLPIHLRPEASADLLWYGLHPSACRKVYAVHRVFDSRSTSIPQLAGLS